MELGTWNMEPLRPTPNPSGGGEPEDLNSLPSCRCGTVPIVPDLHHEVPPMAIPAG